MIPLKSTRQLRFTSLLLAAIFALSACASDGSNKRIDADKKQKLADIHYQLGIDALGKPGMLPKAFDELMESNQIKPNQPHVLDAMAYAWLLRGDLKQSESFYQAAIRHGGGAATHNNYANLLNRQERFAEAETEARKALNDPRYANQDLAFINLGDALSGQKRFNDAIDAYHQAEVFNSESPLPRIRIADAYRKSGQLGLAKTFYFGLYASDKANRKVVEGLVDVLVKLNQFPAARHILDEFSNQNISVMDRAWAREQAEQIR